MAEKAANGAAKKQPRTRVKVVASRYALALQKTNNDNKRFDRQSTSTPASATNDHSKKRSAAGIRITNSERAAPTASVVVTTPPIGMHATPTSVSSSNPPPQSSTSSQDLKERLKAYRASKNLQKRPASVSTKSQVDHQLSHSAPPRPAFPRRIANSSTAERPSKRPTKVASVPPKVETIIPVTISRASSGTVGPKSSITTTATRASYNAQEELELLESLYIQLCFAEAKAEETFRRQEQTAEKQMIGVWNILQSKLQLLHDTSIRLDREKHIKAIEEHVEDQVTPIVQVAARLPHFLENLGNVCASLEQSLHRMPTPGVICYPPELQRHLNALTAEMDGLLEQLQSMALDSAVSTAINFERGMGQMIDRITASLLQVAHLVEELQGEVDSETSMIIQKIQQQRLDAAMSTDDWW